MKKILSLTLFLVLVLSLALTGCGKKAVEDIKLEGLKFEYELNEAPNFSGVTGTIVYNDGTTKNVASGDLTFGSIDTSTAGKKDLAVSYEGFTKNFTITVKSASSDVGAREVESIEYFDGLPANIYEKDLINFNAVKILVNYVGADGEKTEETVSLASNPNIKHNGAEINTNVPGTYTLTFTFKGKSASVDVVVKKLEINELQVDASTVDTTIYENQEFDPAGMIVKAIYNNGGEATIPVADLTITRNGNVVTISYQGKSVDLTLSYDTPFVTAIAITTTGYESKNNTVVFGDKISTAGVVVKATMSNNTTKILDTEEYTLSNNIADVGTGTLTATYVGDESIKSSVNFTVLGITKISIDTATIPTLIKKGGSYSDANVAVIVTLSDGSRVLKYREDGVTLGGDTVDTSTIATYRIKAVYLGIESAMLSIYVHEEANYTIAQASLPDSLAAFEANRNMFMNKNYGYVVGDDNPFIFRLKLMKYEVGTQNVITSTNYTGYSEVWYEGTKLTGDELALYCVIDEVNNSFDFTEEAVGKTFTLKTRPRFGIAEGFEANFTQQITVEVVDALNIYEAWELNYITNYNDNDAPNMENRTTYVDSFLAGKGVTRPESLAGVVIHNDLIVNREDVPAEFFVDGNRNNDFYDYITIFAHATDNNNPTFTFHGNHFTIFSYNLPNVCANGIANQTDYVSSGQLFRFTCNEANASFNHKNYTTNIKNLYLKDNHPNSNNEATADRDMRGLIGMKVQWQIANIENVVIEAYYISFYVDTDRSVANINECNFFNAYQNHIYAYNANQLQGKDETPNATHQPITINITNSKITKCGGPVILTQIEDPNYTANASTGPQVSIDDNTEIWTWVTGTEAWFKATGTTAIANQLQLLGGALAQQNLPTIVRSYGETGETTGTGLNFMNIIMVNIVSGTDVSAILGSTYDLDGKLTIGEKAYLNMNDEVAMNGYGYGDALVTQKFLEGQGQNKILNTYTGGTIVVDANNNFDVPQPAGLTDGEYVALYYGTFGFVFGYAPFQ